MNSPLHHMAYPPGMRPEEKDITDQALHREVFVKRSDSLSFGLGDNGERCRIRYGSTGGDGSESRTAASPNASVHLIAMQHRAASAARCCHSFGQHRDDGLERTSTQMPVRI